MKTLTLSSFCAIFLTGCQFISPMMTDYNGVRRDVATYINTSWQFSLKEREILVAYAKEQQKVTAWQKLSPTEQHSLAQQRMIGRYCAEQKIKPQKLDLVDQQVFTHEESKAKLLALQTLQQNITLDTHNLDCKDKF